MTDSDLDALAMQFLDSAYADYKIFRVAAGSADRGFLLRRGLVRLAEDGDAYGLILDRVMAYLGQRIVEVRHRRQSRRTAPPARDFGPYRRPGLTGRIEIATTTSRKSRR
ncbi:hypothetical protein BZL29_8539 [Mycobacterium kansasii]|uniref:Uncharacterized protein n=1 Tax=Mycobacterium kansasii TaxID=1768 RepID=A0A1V3WAE8_MYCKA|nr:hypothetical protein BZL29_8539 [Mycobacterium kansasii]